MRLLPCLRIDSERWWLPLSPSATEALGRVILSANASSSAGNLSHQELSKRLHSRECLHQVVLNQVLTDPALTIYAALAMAGFPGGTFGWNDVVDSSISSPIELSPRQITRWILDNVTGRFASGDAFMNVPPITAEIEANWQQLVGQHESIPWDRWLDLAEQWLQLLGPSISDRWKKQWPRLVQPRLDLDKEMRDESKTSHPESNDLPEDKSSITLLQQLARQSQQHQSLQATFQQRLRSSKLASIKQLAYGLSHEINNPLANISTRAQALQRSEPDEAKQATLQRIIDQVYRAHEMISDLMFYANPPEINLAPSDLGKSIEAVVDDLSATAERQSIRFELGLPEVPIVVPLDGAMIGEAVRVLVQNSIDAIGCQGTIVVSLVVEPNGLVRASGPSFGSKSPPRRVTIHVADSGPGLSQAAKEHAFDPYYSGREAGRGLGLGLCRAYRIARLHHGTIELAGGPAGCVATIQIPLGNGNGA